MSKTINSKDTQGNALAVTETDNRALDAFLSVDPNPPILRGNDFSGAPLARSGRDRSSKDRSGKKISKSGVFGKNASHHLPQQQESDIFAVNGEMDREIPGVLRMVSASKIAIHEQVRKIFDPMSLEELSRNIEAKAGQGHGVDGTGIIQPITVRHNPKDEGYIITTGERRFRAAVAAGATEVPVIVLDNSTDEAREDAIIENVFRKDLNPLEIAEGLNWIMVKNKYTFRGMAARMGTNKNWVHTHVALLNASPAIQKMVEDRPDTRTHVLPIKAVGEDYLQRRLIKLVVEEEYSARRVRELSASIIMIQKSDDLDSEKKKKFIDKVFSNNWAPSDVCEALGIAEVLPQVVTAHGEASSENSFSPGSAMTQMNPSQGFMAPMSENFGLLGPASSGMTPTIHANDRIHAFGGITRGTGDHPAISVLAQAVRFIEQAERDSRARQVTRDEYNAILDMIEKISSASESIINVIREAPEEEEVSNDDYFDTDRVM